MIEDESDSSTYSNEPNSQIEQETHADLVVPMTDPPSLSPTLNRTAENHGPVDTSTVQNVFTEDSATRLSDFVENNPYEPDEEGLDFGNSIASLARTNFEHEMIQNAFTPPFSLGLALSRLGSPYQEPQAPVTDDEAVKLVRSYLSETATWCDTTDSLKHFSTLSAHDMLEVKMFKGAAMALAARQLSVLGVFEEGLALQCYQYTIRLLIQQDPTLIDAHVLATCILLCVYEMMASGASDWRRHLKVGTALYIAPAAH